jgi:NAD-dependent dihydropyrimidine dehydrogenase PreA subunit
MSDSDGRFGHVDIEWGPTIDAAACTGCGACIDFRRLDVHQWIEDEGQVEIAHRLHCGLGCSHYATLCEAQAISFPTFEEIKRARRAT